MNNSLTLGVVLGASMGAGFRPTVNAAGRHINSLGMAVADADSKLKLARNWPKLQESLLENESRLASRDAEIQALGSIGPLTRKQAQELERLNKSKASLANRNAYLRQQIENTSQSLRAAGISTGDLTQKTAELEARAARLSAIYEKRQIATDNLRSSYMRWLPVIGLATKATRNAIGFETAMAGVRKVVDFDSVRQFEEMGSDIARMATRIPMAKEALAEIVAAGGQAGFARDELLGFAETAAKMGVAFDISAGEAGQMMAQWRTGFRMTQDQVTVLADQINYLGNTGPSNASKISEVVTKIGPLGEVGGLAAAQIAALGATITGMGIETAVAGTGIKNMLLSLTAGEAATAKQQRAFKRLGLDAKQMARLMQTDASGAITKVMKSLQALPEHQRASVLVQLFGRESVGAIAPLLNNLELLQENMRKVGNSTHYAGSMENEFQSMSATTANSLQLLGGSFGRVGRIIGGVFLPPLTWLVNVAAATLNWMADMAEIYPPLTKLVIGLGGGFLLWRSAMAAASLAMTFVTAAAPIMNASIGLGAIAVKAQTVALMLLNGQLTLAGIRSGIAAAAALKLGAAMNLMQINPLAMSVLIGQVKMLGAALWSAALSPIGLIVAGIAGVGYLIYKFREPIVRFWRGMSDGIDNVIGKAKYLIPVIGPMLGMFDLADHLFGNKDSTASRTIAAAAAASPMATSGRPAVSQTNTYQISVAGGTGTDAETLAKEVRRQIDARDRESASRARSALYDNSPG